MKKQENEVKESEKKAGINLDFSSIEVSMESMLKNGVHFGHLKSRKNPRMNQYIFGVRNGVSIIDLQKTLEKLEEALKFIEEIKKSGKKILFVGTKKQAKGVLRFVAEECEMPFVDERWIGGTFTNFSVIRSRARYLSDSQRQMENKEFEKYTKLERLKKMEEIERLEKKMGGIKEMTEMPAAIFVVDTKDDHLAIAEAIKKNIPVIAMVDTNSDPKNVTYPIPANDDAISSIKFILGAVGKTLKK